MTQAELTMAEPAARVAAKLEAFGATLPQEEQEVLAAILQLAAEQGDVTGYLDGRVAGAVAAVALLLGGAGIFGATRDTTPAQGAASAPISRSVEGVTPIGGLAEQIQDQQREAAAQVTTRGGMAELYAEQQADSEASGEQAGGGGGSGELTRGL